MEDNGFDDPFSFDITEIDGFDNLHHAQGILKEAQERAARIYGARESFFLVNGSTAGILSAVSACTSQRGTLLMARNCHRAAYHAAFLKELDTVYVYPEWEERYGLNGGIRPERVEALLRERPDIQAVIITSPTYDGVVSDVRGIAQAVHRHGLALIVDEAHGAHLSFSPYFPESAVNCGADVVIQSVHKTLPSLTQTALLHLCGPYADADRVRKYLSVYQTSSPSYVLLASIDQCVGMLEEQGTELFDRFAERLERFRAGMKELSCLRLAGEEIVGTAGICGLDRSKLVFSGAAAGVGGNELSERLRSGYSIEMEMAAGSYVLGISTVMDTEEGFERLGRAVRELDRELKETSGQMFEASSSGGGPGQLSGRPVCPGPPVLRISEAEDAGKEELPLEQSAGRVSGEYICLYPPGIPLAAPGERICEELLWQVLDYRSRGYELNGMRDVSGQRIRVLAGTKQRAADNK